jgi:thiol-disulfide isomerase/thioredoxin
MIKNFLVFSFLAFTIVFSAIAADNGSFYSGPEGKGYYQYAKPDPAVEIPDNLSVIEDIPDYKRPFVPPDEVLYKMPAEQFQELYTKTLNYALTERNLNTYGDYARMIHMVNVRAKEFASLQMLYAQLHPRADENEFTGSMTRIQINKEKVKVLSEVRDKYSLLYFYSPICPFCSKFEPLLKKFERDHGWEIEYVDIYNNPELGGYFEITATPTVKLVTPNENILPVNNGFVTLEEFEDRLYRFVRYLEGYTDDLTFSKSR